MSAAELVVLIAGESISGPAERWPYQAFGVTSVGDTGDPLTMQQCVYYSGRMMLRNMALAGTRLETGANSVALIRPVYIDTRYSKKGWAKSGPAARRFLYVNAIGTNDGLIGSRGSVAAYLAAVAADGAVAKAAGADVFWMVTYPARGDNVMTELNRSAGNALIRDSAWRAAHGVDGYIDIGGAAHAGAEFLPINSGGDTTWVQADNVHPQVPLAIEQGAIARVALDAYVATF